MKNSSGPPLLCMDGISKSFSGVHALTGVHFDLRPGEVHALMGENGAGKSTLIKMLAGVYSPDAGTIEIDGSPVHIGTPQRARQLGIAVIHQELNTIPGMTVAENLALGCEPLTRLGVLDRTRMRRDAREKLAKIGATFSPDAPIGRLSVGRQQMVEIARAVSEDARILILDEPTASLSEGEAQRLFALIEEMRAAGMGLIYISHRMEEVYRLADRVTIFRDGHWVDTRDRADSTPEGIVTSMVGREVGSLYVHDDHACGDVVLEARGIGNGVDIGPADLQVRAGEVVTLAGLVGAGRTELARLIFGADRIRVGELRLGGKAAKVDNPVDAIRLGIGLVPESRKEQALFLDMAIRDNVVMSALDGLSRLGVLRRRLVGKTVDDQVRALAVRCASAQQLVRGLSGGNQQKVILARWLSLAPRVLLLDEPTRGVDVGAKHEIYRIINELAQRGVAILVVSSELSEVLGISDRILVMRNGRLVHEFDREEATEESIMLYATGVAEGAAA